MAWPPASRFGAQEYTPLGVIGDETEERVFCGIWGGVGFIANTSTVFDKWDHLASGILPRSCPQQAFDQNPNFPTSVGAALGPENRLLNEAAENEVIASGSRHQ